MAANIVRRSSQEIEGSVSPNLFLDKTKSGRVSVASEGDSLANLTQNVFRRVSSDKRDETPSPLAFEGVASLVGKVHVVPSETPIKLVEDYSDSENCIEVIVPQIELSGVGAESSIPPKSDEVKDPIKAVQTQDLVQKIAAEFILPTTQDNQVPVSDKRETVENWVKATEKVSNMPSIEEGSEAETLTNDRKTYHAQLDQRDLDGRIDDFLENNPCTRFANWLWSFIPNFISSPKSSIEKAEDEKASEKQKNYEAFIARVKISDKISKEKFTQIVSASNGALVLKKSFSSYQALMEKDLRGYLGADKDEKVFNRSMESILNARLK